METNNRLEEYKLEKAKKHVEELKCFYWHFAIYLCVVPFFIILNVRSSSFPWAIFPIVGWGLGVLSHASETFQWNPFFGKDWEQRKIKEIMDQDKNLF